MNLFECPLCSLLKSYLLFCRNLFILLFHGIIVATLFLFINLYSIMFVYFSKKIVFSHLCSNCVYEIVWFYPLPKSALGPNVVNIYLVGLYLWCVSIISHWFMFAYVIQHGSVLFLLLRKWVSIFSFFLTHGNVLMVTSYTFGWCLNRFVLTQVY